ncbi:MAG: sulfotransferase [Pseudomonadota bacterium]
MSQATQAPFFLAGCARSGTTLLRDLLKDHPHLECPEETHFFRWADPFGSDRYKTPYLRSPLFRKHRSLDGIDEQAFREMLESSASRGELMDRYGAALLKARGNPEGRWFDKTPQHVYGLLLISATWPEARFVHIHRHPLNVIASLMTGAVMPVQSLKSAINYWNEAMMIMLQFRGLVGDRLIEVPYEALTESPAVVVGELLERLGESSASWSLGERDVHPERHKFRGCLDEGAVERILEQTAPLRAHYGYESLG